MRAWILGLLVGCQQSVVLVEHSEEELFTQAVVVPSSDVLLVIDDSRSMGEEQALLGLAVGALIEALVTTEADVRFAVVTTDAGSPAAGVARGGVLDPLASDVLDRAAAALAVGDEGSRDEQGFAAARLAVDGVHNPGFPRVDARLDLVFIADEDDQSPGEVAAHLDALRGVGAASVTVHGILGDLPDGCAAPGGAADPAPRYHEAVAATSGQIESICAPSYAELLQRVGFEVSGLRDSFPLSKLPVPESLEVWVDGVRLHEREVDGWQYEPGENAVRFVGSAVPRSGMEVLVQYEARLGD